MSTPRYLYETPCDKLSCRNKARYTSGRCGVHDRSANRVELPLRAQAALEAFERQDIPHAPGTVLMLRDRIPDASYHAVTIQALLGDGSSAYCYHVILDSTHLALKAYRVGRRRSSVDRELHCWRKLQDSLYIPQVRGLAVDREDNHYVLSELCAGGSLRTAWEQSPSSAQRWLWWVEILRAVRDVHARGLVHLDLKLRNCVLTAEGGLKLIDFGACCPNGVVLKRSRGTRGYTAPELANVEKSCIVQASLDVYSLGVIARLLRDGEREDRKYRKLPAVWADCLELDPSQRPSADELVKRAETLGMWDE